MLLEAIARLRPEHRTRLEVTIVGQPYIDTSAYRAFVREHGLEETVKFRFGFVEEVEIDRLFADAVDASGVAMTAVAHGLPILASAIGGFKEQFEDGREGRLVPPETLGHWP